MQIYRKLQEGTATNPILYPDGTLYTDNENPLIPDAAYVLTYDEEGKPVVKAIQTNVRKRTFVMPNKGNEYGEPVYDTAYFGTYKYPYVETELPHTKYSAGGADEFDARFNPIFGQQLAKALDEIERSTGATIKLTFGNRSAAQQRDLYNRGFSKTPISTHSIGSAADMFITDKDGKTVWFGKNTVSKKREAEIEKAIRKAVANNNLVWGGDFTSIIDKPHIALYGTVYDQAYGEQDTSLYDLILSSKIRPYYLKYLKEFPQTMPVEDLLQDIDNYDLNGKYPWQ